MTQSRRPGETSLSRTRRVAETHRLLSQRGSSDDARGVEEQVIRLNMVVARDVARRYHGRGLVADDLDQVAYLGLCKAVRKYDPAKATDFHSYAVPTIRGELRRWFRDAGWVVRPPRSVQELQSRVTAAQDDLAHTLGRPPSPEEIADVLAVEPVAVREALAANGCFTPTSLDAPAEGGIDIGARLGGADPAFARAEARVALAPVLAGLSRRERRMLELRFVQGATQSEIGAEIGVTQMQVSRLLSALLARLRKRMTTPGAATA